MIRQLVASAGLVAILVGSATTFWSCAPQTQWHIQGISPGSAYRYETSEKDELFSTDSAKIRFTELEISLAPDSVPGRLFAKLDFRDSAKNTISFPKVDLVQLIPQIQRRDDLATLETVLEEYERFGYFYRADKGEVIATAGPHATEAEKEALRRIWRPNITNNCLEPTKFELVLNTKYYQDLDTNFTFEVRRRQLRTMDHVWFRIPWKLYARLWKIRNPDLPVKIWKSFDELTAKAEQAQFPTELREHGNIIRSEVLEVGHKSGRWIVPLNNEHYLKDLHHLVLNRRSFHSFDDILKDSVRFVRFHKEGVYDLNAPIAFDYSFLRRWDTVHTFRSKGDPSGRHVDLDITGPTSDLVLHIGNLDLAAVNESQWVEIPFGFDPMPLQRWTRSQSREGGVALDSSPYRLKPWALLEDKKTGNVRNNLVKGIERMFIGWQDGDRTTLQVYVTSYERMLPVWMSHVRFREPDSVGSFVRNVRYPGTPKVEPVKPWTWSPFKETNHLPDTLVVKFDSLSHPDSLLKSHGLVVAADSFLFRSAGFLNTYPWITLGAKGWPWAGSTSLLQANQNGYGILSHARGRKFGLISVKVEEFDHFTPHLVVFTGSHNDQTQEIATFWSDGKPGPQIFTLPKGFRNLEVVRWKAPGVQMGEWTLWDSERLMPLPKK
ncbi:MAG: hypothetical protein IPO40_16700 [Fibrobacteres bacterium]|nr:hypothetical protein [Fibrobacterota bacterium]